MKTKERLKLFIKNGKIVWATVPGTIVIAFILTVFIISLTKCKPIPQQIIVLNITSADSVISVKDSLVPPVLYKKMPGIDSLDPKERKRQFINIMLPTILLAKEIISDYKARVMAIAKDSTKISKQDRLLMDWLMQKLNAKSIEELTKRLHLHPVSIILAQSALESGWGTSRFCREANNVFGVWSFNSSENRVASGIKRDQKTIYLRKYDSLIGSVIDYMFTIGRADGFKEFRDMRIISDNPYRLIWFLHRYSEKRLEYIVSLRDMIEHNDLSRYDKYKLVKIDKKDKTWKKLLNPYN